MSASSLSVVHTEPGDYDPASSVLGHARALFAQKPSWLAFFRELIAPEGLIDQTFDSIERAAFESTPAYAEVQSLLAELRCHRHLERQDFEPQRVITVRLPKVLHESLREEAHRLRTSVNVLAVSKLLQAIDSALVPR